MNQKNLLGLDSCFMDFDDPLELFKIWMSEAEKNEINDPNAFSLATTNKKNEPSVRMILLKGFSQKGFVFYTNLNSPKSKDLKIIPKASMCFHWKSLQRQIRISGSINQVDSKEADNYFNSRPYESRIGAWASKQSQPLEGRYELEKRIAKYTAKFNVSNVPRPEFWSGFRVFPGSMEFWSEEAFRLHDRRLYTCVDEGWVMERLYP